MYTSFKKCALLSTISCLSFAAGQAQGGTPYGGEAAGSQQNQNMPGNVPSSAYEQGYQQGLQQGATEAGQADANMLQGQENQANSIPPPVNNPNFEQPVQGENWNFGDANQQ